MIRVLAIDDEVPIRRLLRISLEKRRFQVFGAATGEEGLRLAMGVKPDVVLLDLNLPDMGGREVLRSLREWSSIPVIVLSVRNAEEDIVDLLNGGADDYVVKPFNTGELAARIHVVLRRRAPQAVEKVFTSGDLAVDIANRIVTVGGREVKLTPTEYAILRLLVQHAGKVLTHRQILQEVWGPNAEQESSYLRVYVTQLRKKIENDPARPSILLTEPGVGYRLKAS
jgi:two-component system KDP operon response regulator KdpE